MSDVAPTEQPTLFGEAADGADAADRAVDDAPPEASRLVEVAIDAAGGGSNRTYTYHLPARLADVQPGEAVLVEYGRRQALAIVLGVPAAPPNVATKAVLARVRADGPLLPPLTLALARWIASTYLAPPALVLRSMLPPAFLERLELVAEALPRESGSSPDPPAEAADLLDQLATGPRAVRGLAAPDGRGALIRRLRGLETDGRVSLEWTLTSAAGGPRFERWVHLTGTGRQAHADGAPGRPLGPRQRALIDRKSVV